MEKNRLSWAARRGMLELDLVLVPFLENVYPTLPGEDKLRFQNLLTCEDQDMFNWFLNQHVPEDPELKKIVDIIRANTGIQSGSNL